MNIKNYNDCGFCEHQPVCKFSEKYRNDADDLKQYFESLPCMTSVLSLMITCKYYKDRM